MALFTKKKLSDEERQSWSAQLLEVRQAELSRFGDEPTLGSNWDEHDQEWNRLYAEVYLPQYGILAGAEMANEGLRLSGYRRFLFQGGRGGFILLVDELDDPPPEVSKGEVLWAVNLGTDEDGLTVYGYQYVASAWKHAKSHMMGRVKEWNLENLRNQLFWSQAFNWVGTAILLISIGMILVPVVGGAALGLALGETVSVAGFVTAAGEAIAAGSAAWAAFNLEKAGNLLGLNAADEWVGLDDQVNEGVLVFVGNQATIQNQAPTDGPKQDSGLGALLLAAAGLLIFI